MRLRKWMSNDEDLLQRISERQNGGTTSLVGEMQPRKVLGVVWNPRTDKFGFDLSAPIGFTSTMKRAVLQSCARIFDPFGFLAPVVTSVKLLFQALWERGTDWDDDLPSDISMEWNEWCNELPCLQYVTIPRKLAEDLNNGESTKTLHVFSDASPRAYGAVAYLRTETPQGDVNVSLVMSKSRVAPLKKMSLPRMELMGAVVAARLSNYIIKTLPPPDLAIHLWSDSTVTLHWITGNANRWTRFVANRVSEIQQLTDPANWSHCPGKENPADLLTRGQRPDALLRSQVWWSGPQWLQIPQSQWLLEPSVPANVEDYSAEERKSMKIRKVVTKPVSCRILRIESYSSLTRVTRITAWVKRFVSNCRNRSRRRTGQLTSEELTPAEIYWITNVQRDSFAKDIAKLRSSEPLGPDSTICNLSPYLDNDGILRVGGRLQFSDIKETTKPVILPSTHSFAALLTDREHIRLLHAGEWDTLAQLREDYWIVKGRQAVKKIIWRCLICRKEE
ncbi:uncharacterized protein LOC135398624 [Ornithodoros turicata]|uniref:uncharacterized protein LOC135398624 n=1 Tax=Ornithodoros turicata TaxID=34597 RepID=UPI003138E38E